MRNCIALQSLSVALSLGEKCLRRNLSTFVFRRCAVDPGADRDTVFHPVKVSPVLPGLRAETNRTAGYLGGVKPGESTRPVGCVVLIGVPLTAVGAMKQLGLLAAFKSPINARRVIAERDAECCTAVSPQMISEAGAHQLVAWKINV